MATDDEFPDLQRALELSLELHKLESLTLCESKAPLIDVFPVLEDQKAADAAPENRPYALEPPVEGQEEVIMAIMGPCGSGKTSFINLVMGKDVGVVGHGLDYGTGGIHAHSFSYCNINFTLVDTPGFDDASHRDSDILRMISDWLEQSFRRGEKLTAIMYFHRITDPRMAGSPLRNFGMFKKLCGSDFFPNIVLGTTFWGTSDLNDPGLAERRERDLETNFWGTMIQKGSEMVRIPEMRWLARGLLLQLAKKPKKALQHQVEMVNEGKAFQETAASQALNHELSQVRAEHQRQLQEQRKLLEKAAEESRKRQEEVEKKQKKMYEQQLSQQRAAEERLRQERQRQDEIAARLREEKEKEQERMNREEDALVEDLASRNIDIPVAVRNRYRHRRNMRFVKEAQRNNKRIEDASGSIKIVTYDVALAYQMLCDNCMGRIGTGTYYVCKECDYLPDDVVFEGIQFMLCDACHKAPHVYCDDKSHYSRYEKRVITDTQSGCKRVANPFTVGASISCDGCSGHLGMIYFHCCACNNDQFDLCLDCVLKGKTCKVPSHGIDVVSHYPMTIPEIMSRPKSS